MFALNAPVTFTQPEGWEDTIQVFNATIATKMHNQSSRRRLQHCSLPAAAWFYRAGTAKKWIVHLRESCCSLQGHCLEGTTRYTKMPYIPNLKSISMVIQQQRYLCLLWPALPYSFWKLKNPAVENTMVWKSNMWCTIVIRKLLRVTLNKNLCTTYRLAHNQVAKVAHSENWQISAPNYAWKKVQKI